MIALFLFNIFCNSLLSFLTIAVFLEALIFLLRLPQGRMCSWLRMTVLLKLPLDLFFYNFSRWSYLKGINPLCCEEGSRSFSIFLRLPGSAGIELTAPGSLTFTLADLLGTSMSPLLLKGFCFFSLASLFSSSFG